MNINAIENHKIANKKIDLIKSRATLFIRKNINRVSEKDVCDFILSEMEKEEMITDNIGPIHFVVADENTDDTHWNVPIKKSKIISNNSLIMMDIWARLNKSNSPFVDITWMFYTGKKIPKRIQNTFDKVIATRNTAINFVRKELRNKRLPKTKMVDRAARGYLNKFGLDKFFTHRTGHSIGYASAHGRYFSLSETDKKIIKPDILFTIEPGLYFKGEFGIRSEIDCYITVDYKLVITTSIQRKITKI